MGLSLEWQQYLPKLACANDNQARHYARLLQTRKFNFGPVAIRWQFSLKRANNPQMPG
jgi:hypothetical protein